MKKKKRGWGGGRRAEGQMLTVSVQILTGKEKFPKYEKNKVVEHLSKILIWAKKS